MSSALNWAENMSKDDLTEIYESKISGKDRDLRKEHRRLEKFSTQFGVEKLPVILDHIENLAQMASIVLPDNIVREIEGLLALFLSVREAVSVKQILAIVYLYTREHFNGSMSGMVYAYIESLMIESQGGDENFESPRWLEAFRSVTDNWNIVKNNKLFSQVSNFISVLVVAGLCNASVLDFSVGGFKLFSKEAIVKHRDSFDLLDAIVNTVTYFVEGAYMCFKRGSLKPLLIGDQESLELDDEYNLIMQWWDLTRSGNLEKFTSHSENEFDRRLENLTSKLRKMSGSFKGFEKKLFSDRICKLLTIRNDFVALKVAGGIREAPFALELFGNSSQGKTTFGELLVDALLTSANLPCGKEYRASINAADKYMSTWTSDKLVAIVDDMANEKADKIQVPPTRLIIDLCNNEKSYAPKAEIESKGKCFIEPKIVIVTTNKKDLDAYAYSNCPYSIQRRMHYIITVHAKNQFQRLDSNGVPCGIDSTKIIDFYTTDGEYRPPLVDDIWDITIEQAVAPQDLASVANYEPVTWKGTKMINISSQVAIQYLIEKFNEHRDAQQQLLLGQGYRAGAMKKCNVDGCYHIAGICPVHIIEPHYGFDIVNKLNKVGSHCHDVGYIAFDKAMNFYNNFNILLWLPSFCFNNKYLVIYTVWRHREELSRSLLFDLLLLFFLNITTYNYIEGIYSFILTFLAIYLIIARCRHGCTTIINQYRESSQLFNLLIKYRKAANMKVFCSACATMATVYIFVRFLRSWRKLQAQGNLMPTNANHIAERDAEANIWTSVVRQELPIDRKTSTCDQLVHKIKKNLFYASMRYSDDKPPLMVNVLFLKSNVCLVPDHYFSIASEFDVICYGFDPSKSGCKFRTRLSVLTSIPIPNYDLRVCYSPTGGSFANIIKHFPVGSLPDVCFHMIWRAKDGNVIDMFGKGKSCVTGNGCGNWRGHQYNNLSHNTFKGLCGAVLISQTKGSAIAGIHLGGISDKPYGCSACLTQQQLSSACDKLRKIDTVLITGAGGDFQPVIMDKKIMTDEPMSIKSSLNYMPQNSQVTYYGSCVGGATYYSDVSQTIISDIVKDVTGVANIWGPPKFKPDWFGWQKCIEVLSVPAISFPFSLLIRASRDYKMPLIKLIRDIPSWRESKPLTSKQTLLGIPGKRFIDAIKLDTSIGFPLGGPKKRHVIDLYPTEEYQCNREFTPEVMAEIERCHNIYKNGQRAYTIAKACKKDEALPLSKEKCRIFYGNPIALTYLVRMYFLPIIRFIQMNPLLSECAVGINSHGSEWEQLYQYMITHGKDRIFAGDYSKYDQRMPAQLIEAALRIMIDFAREMDYSEEDIRVMEAMSGDIVFAFIAYNGDLIGLIEGTHISGNSLTVIINSIVGSLNLRCFYYSEYSFDDNFRDYVSIITYGDDNKGSVSAQRPKFNIKGCSRFLAEFGQSYTMPDKESDLTEYMHDDHAEFLKRTSVYHPKLGCHLGALEDNSIFKSLHNYRRGKDAPLTEEEACAQNIDSALREWFNHGLRTYEKRRNQMHIIASRAGIAHMCDMLDVSYDEAIVKWHENYSAKPGDSGC